MHAFFRGQIVRICAASLVCLLLPTALHAVDPTLDTARADSVVVLKKEHKLILYSHGEVLKQYDISLGTEPLGPKTRQGDHKTPEGHYTLDRRNPKSEFYRSIHISYPTAEQVRAARLKGISAGGDVYIHAFQNGYAWQAAFPRKDWTDGCIAVTDWDMDEIWRLVPDGTPIDIKP